MICKAPALLGYLLETEAACETQIFQLARRAADCARVARSGLLGWPRRRAGRRRHLGVRRV